MAAKILVADDDDEIRELIKFFLQQEGYSVIEAFNGEDAFEKARSAIPDLVLLDVMMPKLTGFEVCEKLRSDPKTCLIPVIMLTSLAQTKDKITGIKLGADEYMTKPFENVELLARIESLLRRYKENKATSPLTGLPGNIVIENEIKNRLEENAAFAVLLMDINGFKVYNDKYSFEQGDDVLRVASAIIKSAVTELGGKDDTLAYMGQDNFIVVTTKERAELTAIRFIENFDSIVGQFYDDDVMKRGYVWSKNDKGEDQKNPLLSVGVGIVNAQPGAYKHYSQVMDKAAGALAEAKKTPKSSYYKY